MFKSLFQRFSQASGIALGLGMAFAAQAQSTDVTYLLPAPPNSPAFAPWIIAQQKGYYAAQNLNMTFIAAKGGVDVAKQIGAGNACAALRFVDNDRARRHLAGVTISRIDDAMFDDVRAAIAAIPKEIVEMRHVNDVHAFPCGARVLHRVDLPLRRVVLDVHRRYVNARRKAEPFAYEFVFVRALQDDDVRFQIAQIVNRQFVCVLRPIPRLRATPAVGAAIRYHGNEVVMRSLHERGHPRSVHVPAEDAHQASASAGVFTSRSSAAITSSTRTQLKHG